MLMPYNCLYCMDFLRPIIRQVVFWWFISWEYTSEMSEEAIRRHLPHRLAKSILLLYVYIFFSITTIFTGIRFALKCWIKVPVVFCCSVVSLNNNAVLCHFFIFLAGYWDPRSYSFKLIVWHIPKKKSRDGWNVIAEYRAVALHLLCTYCLCTFSSCCLWAVTSAFVDSRWRCGLAHYHPVTASVVTNGNRLPLSVTNPGYQPAREVGRLSGTTLGFTLKIWECG